MSQGRGRPREGAELVEKIEDCSDQARQRLKTIFQTVAGELTVEQACAMLGINRSAFNKMRSQFIANAVQLLEPRPSGRKRRIVTPEQAQIQQLREENDQLRFQLKAQRVREEIGILMPHLLKPAGKKTKNKTENKQTQARPRSLL
jgi:transposase-like protein